MMIDIICFDKQVGHILSNTMKLFCRSGAVVAKYGDKSVYFDLEDIGNTTGQWDLYGSDAPSPYNSLQVYISTWFLHFTARVSC